MAAEKDVEGVRPAPLSHMQQVFNDSGMTSSVENWDYDGAGTEDDPYVVTWIDHDPRNPMLYSESNKWSITLLVALATLAVAFVSSAYSGGADQVIAEFGCSREVFTLGISLFVLGFAVGPLLWAPLSELFGRRILFIGTYFGLTAFNAGAAGSQNIETLIILRFFAGAIGSSPLTNAGGVIADMFPAKQRGLAMSLFAAAPFMGPVLGPIVGGFVGETVGWRWVEGVMAIFTGVLWIALCVLIPETYAPVILRKRAKQLSKMTGKVYKSQQEIDQGAISVGEVFKTSLMRPWILLFREPIVFLLSIYMAIIYGTLYMLFGAFPIVYQQLRGWSPGIGGLAFLGVAVGMIFAVAYAIWDNKRYAKISDANKGFAPPEARLPLCMVGSVLVPIGMFWFAWTNDPSINFMASIAAGVPFGAGLVLIFLGIMNYLIDSYTIFAASVLAANSVLRSLFGAAFPLFTSQMYSNLGIHWASSVPAFLGLMCVPFPFILYKYGASIRQKCKYAAESDAFMRKMQADAEKRGDLDDDSSAEDSDATKAENEKKDSEKEAQDEPREPVEEVEQRRPSLAGTEHEDDEELDRSRFQPIRTVSTRRSTRTQRKNGYDDSPFDLDRVNTRESFRSSRRNSAASGLSNTVSRTDSSSKKSQR